MSSWRIKSCCTWTPALRGLGMLQRSDRRVSAAPLERTRIGWRMACSGWPPERRRWSRLRCAGPWTGRRVAPEACCGSPNSPPGCPRCSPALGPPRAAAATLALAGRRRLRSACSWSAARRTWAASQRTSGVSSAAVRRTWVVMGHWLGSFWRGTPRCCHTCWPTATGPACLEGTNRLSSSLLQLGAHWPGMTPLSEPEATRHLAQPPPLGRSRRCASPCPCTWPSCTSGCGSCRGDPWRCGPSSC
mmetsp:Transcript_20538/g.57310  ORF Transcript_20538/g.57310 Transcript_20538/m.57310 type:complete len:246 (-) Transcript_20538:138-875(-)